MPGINQLGGALGIQGVGAATDVGGGAAQDGQAEAAPVTNGAVKAVREIEESPKESTDESSVDARREARRFADLQRSKGTPDPETGDVIAISPEAKARSTGTPLPPVEERPPVEDPERPAAIRGEPVRRFEDLFNEGYRRDGRLESEPVSRPAPEPIQERPEESAAAAEPKEKPERRVDARAAQAPPPEKAAPKQAQRATAETLPDERVSAVSDAS